MRRFWIDVLILGVALGAGACRKAPRQDVEARANAGSLVLPRKTADADPAAAASTTFDIDEKTGRSKAVLVLRLDYFPDPKPGVTNLPLCYRAFPETFEVGVAVCDGQPDLKVPVLAKNLDQDCYTDPTVERTIALQPLVMPGCKRGAVLVHAYEPRLRVDLEVRDVN